MGEMAAGRPMNVLRMYKDVPRIFDAWDIDSNYREQEACTARADTLELLKEEGFSVSVRWTGSIGRSAVTQVITLRTGSPVAEFDTTIQWRELHRLLKVEFPVDVRAENAIHDSVRLWNVRRIAAAAMTSSGLRYATTVTRPCAITAMDVRF